MQLGRSLLLDGFQIFIIPAQIVVNAVLQLGALQHTIRFLCCGYSGILKIAPAGIQHALYSAKILLQRDASFLILGICRLLSELKIIFSCFSISYRTSGKHRCHQSARSRILQGTPDMLPSDHPRPRRRSRLL